MEGSDSEIEVLGGVDNSPVSSGEVGTTIPKKTIKSSADAGDGDSDVDEDQDFYDERDRDKRKTGKKKNIKSVCNNNNNRLLLMNSVNSDNDDELLDIEDNLYYYGLDLQTNSNNKLTKHTTRSNKKVNDDDIITIEDERNVSDSDICSEKTENVGSDDPESLISIPSPTPPKYPEDDYDFDEHEAKMDEDDISKPISSTSQINKNSSKSFYADPAAQEIDDFFQEVQYSSLADFLADQEERNSGASGTGGSGTTSKSGSQSSKASTSSKNALPSDSEIKRQIKALTPKKNEKSTFYDVLKERKLKKQQAVSKSKENREIPPSSSSSSSAANSQSSVLSEDIRKKFKSNDALKMIVLKIAEEVCSDDLTAKLLEKEIRFEIITGSEIPNAVEFEHNIPFRQQDKDLNICEKVWKEVDSNVIIIFQVEKQLHLLQCEVNRIDGVVSEDLDESLTEWIQRLQRKHPKKKITLLIHGFKSYLSKIDRRKKAEFRKKVLDGDKQGVTKSKRNNTKQVVELSRNEVQNALIGLQLNTKINYRFYENNTELSTFLTQYAKSIAEAPQKQEATKAVDFDWYAAADSVGGIPVEVNGNGMRSLWIGQLCQFPGVGQESALAISRVYSSPKDLYTAYRACGSAEEARNLLTNIQVRIGVGPFAKTRRLGPEASKKIYRFFTATDGEKDIC